MKRVIAKNGSKHRITVEEPERLGGIIVPNRRIEGNADYLHLVIQGTESGSEVGVEFNLPSPSADVDLSGYLYFTGTMFIDAAKKVLAEEQAAAEAAAAEETLPN